MYCIVLPLKQYKSAYQEGAVDYIADEQENGCEKGYECSLKHLKQRSCADNYVDDGTDTLQKLRVHQRSMVSRVQHNLCQDMCQFYEVIATT